ncbi:hypothetical protein TNCV_2265861 [Trichonephila clavipes]|nr:hypothetical protein TNCV_2265861 [Trichonephila clavipes]
MGHCTFTHVDFNHPSPILCNSTPSPTHETTSGKSRGALVYAIMPFHLGNEHYYNHVFLEIYLEAVVVLRGESSEVCGRRYYCRVVSSNPGAIVDPPCRRVDVRLTCPDSKSSC